MEERVINRNCGSNTSPIDSNQRLRNFVCFIEHFVWNTVFVIAIDFSHGIIIQPIVQLSLRNLSESVELIWQIQTQVPIGKS